MFRFAHPELLWLLLAVPFLAFLIGARGRRSALGFSSGSLVQGLASPSRFGIGALALLFRSLALAVAICTLAQPQRGSTIIENKSEGIDIVLTIDLSLSMWTHDMELDGAPSDRTAVVRRVVKDFIERRPNDRIGIVAFSGDAYVVSPLTLNHEWLIDKNVARLQNGLVPEMGTNIGKALAVSVNRLNSQASKEAKGRVIVLLTDGDSNIKDKFTPKGAAEAAKTLDIKIHAIGLGEEGMVKFPRFDVPFGGSRRNSDFTPQRDRLGNILFSLQPSYINMAALDEIANITGGRSYRAKDTATLASIYDEIDRLEKTKVNTIEKTQYRDIFPYFLYAILGLLAAEWLIVRVIFARLPS